ncbi:ADP-heptose--LPS heptosyltransferase 2 [Paraburkholderia phenoliruptrix]|uniref:lipopolysaccharide heptosyltransferase II n=1 Tax=Paraburkholderia phenoliruptrix TaxID=252970 RepID=A0A6J5A4C8_9BURK|nr:lipopolysaccharide heptosyltransferase II [Paraburkholderia phenoliruptrix]CAB3653335.1 ADP-heptose--LPS heptosyltransferase 2 [Paraburkholderia phenoliruptrix]
MNAPLLIAQPTLAHARVPDSPQLAQWGEDIKRILCVRLDNLGDVLMTTPALHALRESGPGRHITLLASRSGVALAPYLDDVDDVIEYEAPWVASPAASSRSLADDQRMQERLRHGGFDAAVIFTVYSQSPLPAAMLCYLAGIPRRLAHCRENPYALLTDWLREPEPQQRTRHEVERQLDLVRQVGAQAPDTRMRFAVRETDRRSLAQQLAARGVHVDADKGPRCIVLHPGATAASRRYPPERFGQVATRLATETGAPILITGSASERALAQAVIAAAAPRVRAQLHDMSGALSLGELAALIERASVLVSNNSGPVHLASALATPVVDLYALTNPQHTPWQTPHRVLFRDVECRWCYRSVCPQHHHACLLGVTPAEVVTAALELRGEAQLRAASARERAHSSSASSYNESHAHPSDAAPPLADQPVVP